MVQPLELSCLPATSCKPMGVVNIALYSTGCVVTFTHVLLILHSEYRKQTGATNYKDSTVCSRAFTFITCLKLLVNTH